MHLTRADGLVMQTSENLCRYVTAQCGSFSRDVSVVKNERENRGSGGIAPSGVQGRSPWAQVCSYSFVGIVLMGMCFVLLPSLLSRELECVGCRHVSLDIRSEVHCSCMHCGELVIDMAKI